MPQAIASSNLNGLRLKRRTGVQSRLVEGEMIVLDREHDLITSLTKRQLSSGNIAMDSSRRPKCKCAL